MISFDGVVRVLLHNTTRGRQQLIDHPRIDRCSVSGHLARMGAILGARVKNRRVAARSRCSETSTSMTWPNWSIARYRYTHRPATFTYVSSTNQRSPAARRQGSGRVDQQRGEPLHPAVDRDVINADTTFGQQFLDVAVGQVVARGRPSGEVPLEWSCSRRPPPEPVERHSACSPRVRFASSGVSTVGRAVGGATGFGVRRHGEDVPVGG